METNPNKIYFGIGSLVFLITIVCGIFISSQYMSIAKTLRDNSPTSLKKITSCQKLADIFEQQGRSYMRNDAVSLSAPGSATQKGGGAEEDYSQTNVQVQGVDEADMVKTDGEYIYKVKNNKIIYNKSLSSRRS